MVISVYYLFGRNQTISLANLTFTMPGQAKSRPYLSGNDVSHYLFPRVGDASGEEDGLGRLVVDNEDERTVDGQADWLARHYGSQAHNRYGSSGRFGARFIDAGVRLVDHRADVQVTLAVHAREISLAGIEGIRHAHLRQRIAQREG